MKKIIAAILCILMLSAVCFGTAGCGKKSSDSDDKSSDSDPNSTLYDHLWVNDMGDYTYYYDFSEDGKLTVYYGSIEGETEYELTEEENGYAVSVPLDLGDFQSKETAGAATFSFDGSEDDGDLTVTFTYHTVSAEEVDDDVPETSVVEGSSFILKQTDDEPMTLDTPEDFKGDSDLIGTWVLLYDGIEETATFSPDGRLVLENDYASISTVFRYNCTYTVDNGNMTISYFAGDMQSMPTEYSVKGDILNFMGYDFAREGSDAADGLQNGTETE